MSEATTTQSGAVVITNSQVYQAIVIKNALNLYARTGMKVNTAYTPSNMMRVASQVTGKKFKARDYTGAAAALEEWLKAHQPQEEEK